MLLWCHRCLELCWTLSIWKVPDKANLHAHFSTQQWFGTAKSSIFDWKCQMNCGPTFNFSLTHGKDLRSLRVGSLWEAKQLGIDGLTLERRCLRQRQVHPKILILRYSDNFTMVGHEIVRYIFTQFNQLVFSTYAGKIFLYTKLGQSSEM